MSWNVVFDVGTTGATFGGNATGAIVGGGIGPPLSYTSMAFI